MSFACLGGLASEPLLTFPSIMSDASCAVFFLNISCMILYRKARSALPQYLRLLLFVFATRFAFALTRTLAGLRAQNSVKAETNTCNALLTVSPDCPFAMVTDYRMLNRYNPNRLCHETQIWDHKLGQYH